MRPKRIAFYGNFGDGNLGNEVTLQTVIEHTRRRWPDAELECICTGPEDVRVRHGIAAFCSLAWRPGGPWLGLAAGAEESDGGPGASGAGSSLRRWVAAQRAKRRLAFRLVARAVRSLKWLLYKVPLEATHWMRSLRVVARQDMLIVPGTGIVTDHRCGPWSWPYELFKYSALAALCRVKLVYISVGAGPIGHPVSRWLIKRSLGLARYRSYRDEHSRQYLAGLGFDCRRDPLYPDLVFGLAAQDLPPGESREARRRVVGLGLKDYSGPQDGSGDAGYRQYLAMMAAFVSGVGRRGYTVRLLIGDVRYDTRVLRDLEHLLARRESAAERTRVLIEPAPTVGELIRQLAETDVIISPRLHNLILALMLGKPVIALCDLPKVRALLGDLELAEYCLALDTLDVATLSDRFARLESDTQRLTIHIRERVDSYRQAVEEQYALLFDDARLSSPAREPAAATRMGV
jgi:polysaccharide pyruvyl transferase WcaK-like protein